MHSLRRTSWPVHFHRVALPFAAVFLLVALAKVARADEIIASLYSFSSYGSVDLLNPVTNTDVGAFIPGLSAPSGIAIGTDGSIYVAIQGTQGSETMPPMPGVVQQYSPTFTTNSLTYLPPGTTGSGIALTNSNTLPLPSDEYNGVVILSTGGVRVGPDGNVYATDYAAGYRTASQLPDTALFEFSGSNGSYVNSAVSAVTSGTGIAFDNAGNIYVADLGVQGSGGGQVIKYNPSTQTQTSIITTGSGPSSMPLANPEGLVLLPNGHLLVSDVVGNGVQGNLLEYTTSGAYVANSIWPTAAANYNAYLESQPAPSQNPNGYYGFFPANMTLTPNGQNILVANLGADFVDGTVVEFNLNGNVLKTIPTGLASDVAVLQSPAVTWNSATSGGLYSNGSTMNWTGPAGIACAPNSAGANATFGPGSGGTVTINGQFTVGTLAFNSMTAYLLLSADDTSSITLNNNGLGAMVTVPSSQTHAIDTNLILTDIGSTAFNIGSGGELDIGGPITGSGALALTGGGNLVIGSNGSIGNTGGTTIENGQLKIGSSASISGPVTLMVAYGYNGELDLAAPSTTLTSLTSSTDCVAGTTAAVNVCTGSTLTTPALSVSGTLNFNSAASASGSIAISGAPTMAAGSQLNVSAGTLTFNITNGTTASIGSGATVAVAAGATLQLAGSASSLSDGSAIAPSSGNLATVANSGTLQVTGTNQSVGAVTGSATSTMDNPTTYDGDTVVGDGMSAANLTVTQILQNSLTINAGSTVTIRPSGSGIVTMDTSTSSAADVASSAVASGSDSDADPLAAIHAAIASGAITSAKGEQLENRIAAIARLATTDPELDVSLLENRILAAIPSPSLFSASSSAADEPTFDLLDADLSTSESGSSQSAASAEFSASGDFGAGSAAVPEPSGWLLAALGALGLATAAMRRTNIRQIVAPQRRAAPCCQDAVRSTANCETFP